MQAGKGCVLTVSVLLLSACGGGGGGGGGAPSIVRTTVQGTVAPPAVVTNGSIYLGTNDMLTAPNAMATSSSIVQGMMYAFDPAEAAAGTLKVNSLSILPVDTQNSNSMMVTTGAAYPTDPALGQTTAITNTIGASALPISVAGGAVVTVRNDLAGLPTVVLSNAATATASGYVLPFSATLNPSGYTYQTFGVWIAPVAVPATPFGEYYFSTGVITAPATLPVIGTASYTGMAAGSYVDAPTRDPGDITATMNATVDFAARTVAFATTATTSLSNNAPAGTLATANPGLDMSGTLSYAAGSNTFTGAVTTANGMSGNATGRFYGPGIAVATPTKAVGAPPEIGGTFAVMNPATGALHGAFGGK